VTGLEIGTTEHYSPEWTTVDVRRVPGVDHVCEWGWDALPFVPATFDEVYAAHVIEHVPWFRTLHALRDACRVLRPGGTLTVHTVNFRFLVAGYLDNKMLEEWTCGNHNQERDPVKWVASRVFAYGNGSADPNWHKALFDRDYLAQCLEQSGFREIEDAGQPRGPQHGPCNLGLKAVKR
jgi:predicted SAM-dependent methyltransferase